MKAEVEADKDEQDKYNGKATTKPSHEGETYQCDEYVYEATTLSDLNGHKNDNYNVNFRCDECGHTLLTEKDHETHESGSENVLLYLCNECENKNTKATPPHRCNPDDSAHTFAY